MHQLFAVIRTRGPAWQSDVPMESQLQWRPHADFMTGLHREGWVVLVGPLVGSDDVLLIARAQSAEEIVARLSKDPWVPLDLLRIKRIDPWDLRLGALPQ